ncbi:MAG: RCC1 domain-containing protein, partial [bacterium]
MTCALTEAVGGVRCFGYGLEGAMGDGTTADRLSPPSSDQLTGVSKLAVGSSGHVCVIMVSNGGVRCWGFNGGGQCGNGGTSNVLTIPSTDVLTGAAEIDGGGQHTCALMAGAGVGKGMRCWGGGSSGQLGNGYTTDVLTPPVSDTLTGVAKVVAGYWNTCVIMAASNGLRCFGRAVYGVNGNGDTTNDVVSVPAGDILTGVADVVLGDSFACALMLANSGVRCWGSSMDGALGVEPPVTVVLVPPSNDVITGVQQLAADFWHVGVVLETSLVVKCWGYNQDGELGNGNTNTVYSP